MVIIRNTCKCKVIDENFEKGLIKFLVSGFLCLSYVLNKIYNGIGMFLNFFDAHIAPKVIKLFSCSAQL